MKTKSFTFHFSSLALIAATLMVLTSCHHDGFTFSGTIEGGAGHTLWLEELAPEGPLFIDSIPVAADGSFKFHYKAPYHSLYNLHTSADNFIVTLPDNGEEIHIEGHWDNLSLTYNIDGSPESILLWQLQQYTNDGAMTLRELVDSVNRYDELLANGSIRQADYDRLKAACDSVYRATRSEQQEYVRQFIEENKGSLATLIALYKPFNNHPLIDPRNPDNFVYFDLVLQGLVEKQPQNPHTIHFKNSTDRLRSAHNSQQESVN